MDIKILVTPKSATTTFRITQHGRKDINGPLDPRCTEVHYTILGKL